MSRRARQRSETWAAKRGWVFGPDPVEDDDSEGGQPDAGRARSPRQKPVMRTKRAHGGHVQTKGRS